MSALIVVLMLTSAVGAVLGVAIGSPCMLNGYATHSVADSNKC